MRKLSAKMARRHQQRPAWRRSSAGPKTKKESGKRNGKRKYRRRRQKYEKQAYSS